MCDRTVCAAVRGHCNGDQPPTFCWLTAGTKPLMLLLGTLMMAAASVGLSAATRSGTSHETGADPIAVGPRDLTVTTVRPCFAVLHPSQVLLTPPSRPPCCLLTLLL